MFLYLENGEKELITETNYRATLGQLYDDIYAINDNEGKSKLSSTKVRGIWDVLIDRTSQLDNYDDAIDQVFRFLNDLKINSELAGEKN